MIDSVGTWLIDVYFVSTVLVVIGGLCLIRLRQPARRLAVARSESAGLVAIAVLAAMPAWPRVGGFDWRVGPVEPRPNDWATAVPAESGLTPIVVESSPRAAIGNTSGVASFESRSAPIPPSAIRALPWHERLPWRPIVGLVLLFGATSNLAWLALGAFEATRLRQSGQVADVRVQRLVARGR